MSPPSFEQAKYLFGEGLKHLENGQLDLAESAFLKSLEILPGRKSTIENLSIIYTRKADVLTGQNKVDEALTLYKKALELNSSNSDAWYGQGVLLCGYYANHDDAITHFKNAIEITPKNHLAHYGLGVAYQSKADYLNALDSHLRATEIKPDYHEAWINSGISLADLNRHPEAINNYLIGIEINPNSALPWLNLGASYAALKAHEKAIDCYDKALQINKDYAEAWSNKGNSLASLGRHELALSCHEQALKIDPSYAQGWYNQGILFNSLKFYNKAAASFERAAKINPNDASAWRGQGDVQYNLENYESALDFYQRALDVNPRDALTWTHMGNTLALVRNFSKALENYAKALEIDRETQFLAGNYLHTKMRICDWSNYRKNTDQLKIDLVHGLSVSEPFPLLSLFDDPSLQKLATELYVSSKLHAISTAQKPTYTKTANSKIKIAYFSADFREHPVSFLTASLFEDHDRSIFEVIGFYYGPVTSDAMHKRLSNGFDVFLNVAEKSSLQIAHLAHEMQIDIAIDLGGHTLNGRPEIFMHRAAPVQISYIGYLGTMGLAEYDYLMADDILVPPENQIYYSEKVIYLRCYQAHDGKRQAVTAAKPRSHYGLPVSGFVFCCFNNSYKITPDIFEAWMKILLAVPASVLFLYEENNFVTENLLKEAVQWGVDRERIIFGKSMPRSDYVARLSAADLFLDTFPYNAGTTASDALWAGLPVLTLAGQSFASKMASSILSALELGELTTTTLADYEALAIKLATDKKTYHEIKLKLDKKRQTGRLFNAQEFVKDIESAYIQVHQRRLAGLPPDHTRSAPL